MKKDLASLGASDLIIKHRNHYRIHLDEVECDYQLFEAAADRFRMENSCEAAEKILSLYKGVYLSDYEAFWATAKRVRYQKIFEHALEFMKNMKHANSHAKPEKMRQTSVHDKSGLYV